MVQVMFDKISAQRDEIGLYSDQDAADMILPLMKWIVSMHVDLQREKRMAFSQNAQTARMVAEGIWRGDSHKAMFFCA